MASTDGPSDALDARPRRNWKRMGLRLVGSAVILGLVLALLPLDQLGEALSRIPPGAWALGLATYLLLHLLGIAKWHLMVNAAGAGFAFPDAVRCYYYGLFGNLFLPSLVGGDAVRAGLAMRLSRSRTGLLFGSVLDRMVDVAVLALLAGLGAFVIPGALNPDARRVFFVLAGGGGAVALLGGAALVLLPARRFPRRIRKVLVKLRQAWRALRARPGPVLVALVLGLGLQSALVLLNAWLGAACGIEISLQAWFFAWPMAKVSALVPVTQGGIGIREAALAGLLAPFGVAPVLAFAAGLVFQTIVLSGGLCGGLIAYLMGRSRPTPVLAGSAAL